VALRWEQVDTERRRVEVKEAATEISGRLTICGDPMTPRGIMRGVMMEERLELDRAAAGRPRRPGTGLLYRRVLARH